MRLNKPQSYALVNSKTKKIVKHLDRLQYFRTKQLARSERIRLQHKLGIKIEISKVENKKKKNE